MSFPHLGLILLWEWGGWRGKGSRKVSTDAAMGLKHPLSLDLSPRAHSQAVWRYAYTHHSIICWDLSPTSCCGGDLPFPLVAHIFSSVPGMLTGHSWTLVVVPSNHTVFLDRTHGPYPGPVSYKAHIF